MSVEPILEPSGWQSQTVGWGLPDDWHQQPSSVVKHENPDEWPSEQVIQACKPLNRHESGYGMGRRSEKQVSDGSEVPGKFGHTVAV